MLELTNAFPNVANLAKIPLLENPWLPTTALENVDFVRSAKAVPLDKLLIANVGALLAKRLVLKIARLAELLVLDVLDLVLLKD